MGLVVVLVPPEATRRVASPPDIGGSWADEAEKKGAGADGTALAARRTCSSMCHVSSDSHRPGRVGAGRGPDGGSRPGGGSDEEEAQASGTVLHLLHCVCVGSSLLPPA
ncbi:Hypothetical protein SMAX5B_014240 [Scophthalmus maximus]|uniref:Uncharacterized protein n=1 Tax=Scophthalmus maximus TaxID=52904 RepID=A0A2U9BG56_SCOMX|nr:Hypothetical protein SMAX5B_014240 [Scophthalmus maximus]